MKKVIYIVIRYSVLLEGSISWNLSRLSINEYREQLFNAQRLSQRIELFKKITLPSIINQEKISDDIELKLFILTSEDLPKQHSKELEELIRNYSFAYIKYLPQKGVNISNPIIQDLKQYKEKVLYATLRLDDDDALATNYLKELTKFFSLEHIGYVISFGSGLAGYYDFELKQYTKLVEYYSPKIGIGLCHINSYQNGVFSTPVKTIFNAGGHTKVDRNAPLILYSNEIMFIRTFYKESDSSNKVREKKIFSLTPLDPTILSGKFLIKGFNNQTYYDSNSCYLEGVSYVDRTYYNKRFDLIDGERVYGYTFENYQVNFFARIKPGTKYLKVYTYSNSSSNTNIIGYQFDADIISQDGEFSIIYFAKPRYIGTLEEANVIDIDESGVIRRILTKIIEFNDIPVDEIKVL